MAETITARAANQHFSRLLREAVAGTSVMITHRGRSVARLVPEASPETRRLSPQEERTLAESVARARSLQPRAKPTGLPADWPRDRDDLHDAMPKGRPGQS